jgi:hypothetical protein
MKNGITERRQGAFNRLEAQLKNGKKPYKVKGDETATSSTNKLVDLEENDIKRIKKELKILKERMV